jgi:hypothetical protein
MATLKYKSIDLNSFELLDTLGLGSFGRVRLVKFKANGYDLPPPA